MRQMPWNTRPSEDSVHTSSSPPPTVSPSRDKGRPADLNRPLPPLPSEQLDYDTPTLRRKPPAESKASSTLKHNRSFSHPFPSFFGGKRTERKNSSKREKNSLDVNDDESSVNEDVIRGPDSSSPKPARNTSVKTDRQPVTGKCMTCDSTVRWPQGLKVFRCSICLTINDLELQTENRNDTNNLDIRPSFTAPRKPVPLSVDKTRALIDLCITDYLEKRLEDNSKIVPAKAESPPSPSIFDEGDTPEGLFFNQDQEGDLPSSFLRPKMKIRSTSDSTLAPRHSGRNVNMHLMPGHPMEPQLRESPIIDAFDNNAGRPDGSYIYAEITPAQPTSPTIFRTLETYILGCFAGCTALNTSFFTIRPQQTNTSLANPRGNDDHVLPAGNSSLQNGSVALSELDAKTLLLGDVAENGSWWVGSRTPRTNVHGGNVRDRSPDSWKGAVSAKTPRIDWAELSEWYKLVTHASDTWRQKWQALRPADADLQSARGKRWLSIPSDDLDRVFLDSQTHVQRTLLKATENLLKRPGRPLKHPEDCRFLLMLLANPLLHSTPSSTSQTLKTATQSKPPANITRPPAEMPPKSPSTRNSSSARKGRGIGHHSGIMKRILGLVANLSNEIHQFIVSWFCRFSDNHFERLIDLIGRFVTYRLSRQPSRKAPELINPTAGLVPSFADSGVRHPSQLHAALDMRHASSSSKPSDGKPQVASYSEDWQVRVAARVMALLFAANTGHATRKRDANVSFNHRLNHAGLNAKHHAHVHGQIVPISNFYNTMLDYADLLADFDSWETTKSKFTFCQYPFFLSIYAKIHILEYDARRQMENKAREAFFDSILSRKTVSQFLVLKVRRDCLVDDSLRSVSEVVGSGGGDIKKGLKIDFVGEEGIDAGGLRKEWFLLLTREIFDPHHGLFLYDEDSQFCYFNPFCFESSEQFFLVGVLLGLAIYNSTILDIAFPPFVFKKLLASAPPSTAPSTSAPRLGHSYTLEDLAEYRPALARGLRQLLEFEGDVQETFCRDFVVEMDRYGEIAQVQLCAGGEKRAVTNSNRREFVDMYINYLLDTAVARQYEPFKRGFFTVCGGNALSLFRPEEIELLVRGSDEPLDIASLRAVALYEGWPKGADATPPEQQPQVVWFWEFFQRATPADQRKILSFITGSDRIPAMGATNLNIRITLLRGNRADKSASATDLERFPIARTCFNQLNLYPYERREKLEEKLWMAVVGSEGFGLK